MLFLILVQSIFPQVLFQSRMHRLFHKFIGFQQFFGHLFHCCFTQVQVLLWRSLRNAIHSRRLCRFATVMILIVQHRKSAFQNANPLRNNLFCVRLACLLIRCVAIRFVQLFRTVTMDMRKSHDLDLNFFERSIHCDRLFFRIRTQHTDFQNALSFLFHSTGTACVFLRRIATFAMIFLRMLTHITLSKLFGLDHFHKKV